MIYIINNNNVGDELKTYQATLCKILGLECIVVGSALQELSFSLVQHLETTIKQETNKNIVLGPSFSKHNIAFTINPAVTRRPTTQGAFLLDSKTLSTEEDAEDELFSMIDYYSLLPFKTHNTTFREFFEHVYYYLTQNKITRHQMLHMLARQKTKQYTSGTWLFVLAFQTNRPNLLVFSNEPQRLAIVCANKQLQQRIFTTEHMYKCFDSTKSFLLDCNHFDAVLFIDPRCNVEFQPYTVDTMMLESSPGYQDTLWVADAHKNKSNGGCKMCDAFRYNHDAHDVRGYEWAWIYGSKVAMTKWFKTKCASRICSSTTLVVCNT